MSQWIKKLVFAKPDRDKDFGLKNIVSFSNVGKDIPVWQTCNYTGNEDILVKIFYSHGNGEDLYSVNKYLTDLIDEFLNNMEIDDKQIAFALWAWEYPFYGESLKPFEALSEKGIKKDAITSYKAFHNTKFTTNTKTRQIEIVMGYSLGCFPTLYLSTKFSTIDACLLFAPFKNISSAIGALGGVSSYFFTDTFSNYKLLPKAICKVYTIQSKDDDAISYRGNSEVFKEFSTKYLALEKKKHTWFTTSEGLLLMQKTLIEIIELILLK